MVYSKELDEKNVTPLKMISGGAGVYIFEIT